MLLFVGDNTYSTCVTSTSHHNSVTGIVFDDFRDLSSCDVEDNGVVDLSSSSRSSDGSSIVGDQVMDSFHTGTNLLHFTELVTGLVSSDTVAHKSTFDIVEKSEELTSLLDRDHIHETSRVCLVGTYTTIDLDQSLHHDLGDVRVIERILETISEENGEGQAFAQLVWAWGGSWSKCTTEFVQHPMFGRIETLQMLLRTSNHFE